MICAVVDLAVGEHADEVAHGAAGHEERGLLAGQGGHPGLQGQHRGVVPEHVVTNLGAARHTAHRLDMENLNHCHFY